MLIKRREIAPSGLLLKENIFSGVELRHTRQRITSSD